MRFVCLSDTHGHHSRARVPNGDVVIHAGDFTERGTLAEVEGFLAWFAALPHRHKILVAGNHDFLFEVLPVESRWVLPKGITYLQDETADIEGLRVYGAPWNTTPGDWAFKAKRGAEIASKWDFIPADTDILVTHEAPYGMLDYYPGTYDRLGGPIGCQDLAGAVNRVRPRLHVFGHIHAGYGMDQADGMTFVNAALLANGIVREPLVVDF